MPPTNPGGIRIIEPSGRGGGNVLSYPVWFSSMSSAQVPVRVFGTVAQKESGWSGYDSFNTEVAAGKIKAQNGIIYAPYTVFDAKSMAKDFVEQEKGVFLRGDRYYSMTKLNGQEVFQPIFFGGNQGAFGAQDALTATERAGMALVMARQFDYQQDNKKSWFADPQARRDAARFVTEALSDPNVMAAFKDLKGSKDGLNKVVQWAEGQGEDKKENFPAADVTKLRKIVTEATTPTPPPDQREEDQKPSPSLKQEPSRSAKDDPNHESRVEDARVDAKTDTTEPKI